MDKSLIFFIIPIVLVAGFMIYQVATKGFKGATFGGQILKTHGEFELAKRGILSGDIKVHTIEAKDTLLIGIEINHKTFASFEMTALTFEKEDIQDLILTLDKALSESERK